MIPPRGEVTATSERLASSAAWMLPDTHSSSRPSTEEAAGRGDRQQLRGHSRGSRSTSEGHGRC